LNQLLTRLDLIVNEEVCPICYSCVKEEFVCPKCNKEYHERCVEGWVRATSKVDCPTCRVDWSFLKINFSEQLHEGMTCYHCDRKVRGRLFRCLLCKRFLLCDACYASWAHIDHNCFLVKCEPGSKWQPAPFHRFSISTPTTLFSLLQ
jgi:hypothetical protein